MADRETVIRDLRYLKSYGRVNNNQTISEIAESAIELLKEQEEEIKHLRLALDIMKGKGIKVDAEGR